MIKAAIFDLDGTLLDSMHYWDNASADFLRKRGIEPHDDLRQHMFVMTLPEAFVYIRDHYDETLTETEFLDSMNESSTNFYFYKVLAKKGVAKILELLQKAGIPMAIATVTDRIFVEKAIRRLKLDHYFKAIFTTAEVGKGKSDPQIFLDAAAFLGAKPQESLIFEDAPHALETAANADFITVGVKDNANHDRFSALKDYANYVVDDYQSFVSELEQILYKR